MLLENKVAVVYGGGGYIGSAVAAGLAREGAQVFLAGRTQAKLDAVAEKIRAAGGAAATAQVDALDERSVDAFADEVADKAGGIDISFNAITIAEVMGTPLIGMSVGDFIQPITTAMTTQFLTCRTAARYMVKRGSGVIMMVGGSAAPIPALGGYQVANEALEGLRQQWAVELGPSGIRVITLRTIGIADAMSDDTDDVTRGHIVGGMQEASIMNRAATMEDLGNVAAFVASDKAKVMTSTAVNITCGGLVD